MCVLGPSLWIGSGACEVHPGTFQRMLTGENGQFQPIYSSTLVDSERSRLHVQATVLELVTVLVHEWILYVQF